MVYAEIIFETGAKSVVAVEDMDAFKAALVEQNDRAKTGRPGGPDGHAGERVKRVLLYKQHPGDVNEDGCIDHEQLVSVVGRVVKDGKVNVWELISALRSELSPLTLKEDTGAHDSNYRMKEYDELALDWLDFDPKKGAEA